MDTSMNPMPAISIVIPNYNGSKIIAELLYSLEKQTYRADLLDIIVVDDASTDASVAIIRDEFPRVRLIENEKRRGPAFSKNRGVDAARYPYILFLDSDILLVDDTIEFLASAAMESDAVCFQPKLLFYDQSDHLNSTGGVANIYGYAWDRGIYEKDNAQYDHEPLILFATSATLLMRKDIFRELGGFDSDFFYLNEDYDLGYRIALMGMKSEFVPRARCYHYMSYTMGRDNARVKYLIERNRMATILKNYEAKTLRALFFDILNIKKKTFLSYSSKSSLTPVAVLGVAFKSWVWLIFRSSKILQKRAHVQKMRKVSDREIFALFPDYETAFPSFSKIKGKVA
jgi:GT2 family glycosyltransferase